MITYCVRCHRWRALDPVAYICADCYEDFYRHSPDPEPEPRR